MNAFNPSTWLQIGRADLPEFKASLDYSLSSRTAKATQKDPFSRKKQNQNKTTKPQKAAELDSFSHGVLALESRIEEMGLWNLPHS